MNSEIPICKACLLNRKCAAGIEPITHSTGLYTAENITCAIQIRAKEQAELTRATKASILGRIASIYAENIYDVSIRYASGSYNRLPYITKSGSYISGQIYPPTGLLYASGNRTEVPVFVTSTGRRFIPTDTRGRTVYKEIPGQVDVDKTCDSCKYWKPASMPGEILEGLTKTQNAWTNGINFINSASSFLDSIKSKWYGKRRKHDLVSDLGDLMQISVGGSHHNDDYRVLVHHILNGNSALGVCQLKDDKQYANLSYTPSNMYCTAIDLKTHKMKFEHKK